MKSPLPLLFGCLSLAFPALAAEDAIYLAATETEAISAKEGQKVVVHGWTTGSAKSSSGTNFVNFENAEFYLVTFQSDVERFEDGEPHRIYDGERLAVEGVVSIYQDKPQIKLASPEQVTVLSEDEQFPPPQPEAPDPEKTAKEPESREDENPDEDGKEEEKKRKPPVDASEYFD